MNAGRDHASLQTKRSKRLVCVAALAIVAACQGASQTDIFDSSKAPPADASIESDATASSSGGADPDAEVSSSSSSSGASDAAADSQPEAGPDPDPTAVFCTLDVGYCTDPAAPVCCGVRAAGPNLAPFQCKAACAAETETTIDCDDIDDCDGNDICCITHNPETGQPQSVQCQATCVAVPTDSVTIMCDPLKPSPCDAFQAGWVCKEHPTLPGLYACLP